MCSCRNRGLAPGMDLARSNNSSRPSSWLYLDFDPVMRRLLRDFIGRILPLKTIPSGSIFTTYFKEQTVVTFDVIEIKDSHLFPHEQLLQHGFSLNQRQYSQVFSVEVEQVERDEYTLTATEQQIAKHRTGQ